MTWTKTFANLVFCAWIAAISSATLASESENQKQVLRVERVQLTTSVFNLGVPELRILQATGTKTFPLAIWRPSIEELVPATQSHFDTIDTYRKRSVRGFWVGLAGAAVGLYYVDRHVPRTIGNTTWGVGWLTWLGYAALTDAELEDMTSILQTSLGRVSP